LGTSVPPSSFTAMHRESPTLATLQPPRMDDDQRRGDQRQQRMERGSRVSTRSAGAKKFETIAGAGNRCWRKLKARALCEAHWDRHENESAGNRSCGGFEHERTGGYNDSLTLFLIL
jgi:hypothetical protein